VGGVATVQNALDEIIKSGGQTQPQVDKIMRAFMLQHSCRRAMVAAAAQL